MTERRGGHGAQLGRATEAASSEEGGTNSDISVDELTFEQILDNEIGLVQKLHHSNIIKINEVRFGSYAWRLAKHEALAAAEGQCGMPRPWTDGPGAVRGGTVWGRPGEGLFDRFQPWIGGGVG